MRIVFLNPVGKLGGAERGLLDTLSSLRHTAPTLDLTLVALTPGPLIQEARALGVGAVVVPMPARLARIGDSQGPRLMRLLVQALAALPAGFQFLRRLRHQLAVLAPDLIHTNGIKAHLLARFARPPGLPVVWHVQDFLGQRPLARHALRHARRGLVGAIAISEAVKRDLAQILPGVLVTVILNAIDVDHFCPASADGQMLDQLAGLPAAQPGTLRVGLVATYARWKGHEVFLQAAARVCSEAGSFPVRFYIVGGPIYLTSAQFSNDELRQMTRDLGLEGRVGFVPFQSDTLQTYRCLDIVVHASTKPEPFGLTIVEAMACGRAVIVAKAGGAAELFQSDEDAVGVPPGNVAALAAAIAGLLHDSEKRTRLGQAARRSAVARFDRSRLGPEVLNFYKSVLGSGGQCAERDALVRT